MSLCKEQRKLTIAKQVDHIVPHKYNIAVFWDIENNWQALCSSCGGRKSKAGL